MSRRHGVAAPAEARPNGPSRRTLIAGATANPLPSGGVEAQKDQSVVAGEAWLALHAEHERLSRRWAKLEAKLAREHDFLPLSRQQQKNFTEARELYFIDERLGQLRQERQDLLQILPTLVATSALGLAGKLAVAAIEVGPEDNKQAYDLIASILRDLKAVTRADPS